MKLSKPSIKISFKPNWKKIGLVFISSLFSAVLFSFVLISIPQTEKFLKTVRYDLVKSPEYWQKNYVLQLTINPQDESNSPKLINEMKDIIYTRLKTYGVETVTIEQSKQDKNKPELTVSVVTNKDATEVERLVGQRYFIQFVIRKPGINFDDAKNQLVLYDINNYDKTDFTRYNFRTVYVASLKSTSGSYAYFAIYKPWENSFNRFYGFFDKYAGQYAGIAIDDFVNPIMVPTTQVQNSNGNIQRQPFAIALSTDAKAADLQNILLNSGVIPVNYSLLKTNDLSITKQDTNYIHYIQISSGLMIIALVLGMIIKRKEFDTIKFLFISSLPIFIIISIAKVINYPLELNNLFIAYSISISLNVIYVLIDSAFITNITMIIALILAYLTLLSFGKVILLYTMVSLFISLILDYIYPLYIDLIKRSLSK